MTNEHGKDVRSLAKVESFTLQPRDFREALEFGKLMASSDMVPKDYRGKPANVLVAVQMGREIGLSPVQAIQNIAVINGRPSLWGDAMLAVVKAHRLCRGVFEEFDDDTMTASCRVRRQGDADTVRTFSMEDAQRAGLWGKQGPWTQYPKRMLQMRARAFALRDAFPDALRGLSCAEEVEDYSTRAAQAQPANVVDAEVVEPRQIEAHAVESEAQAKPQSALPSVLECIANASNLAELSACKERFTELTIEERGQAIDAGVAKKMELADQAAEQAVQQSAESEQ